MTAYLGCFNTKNVVQYLTKTKFEAFSIFYIRSVKLPENPQTNIIFQIKALTSYVA